MKRILKWRRLRWNADEGERGAALIWLGLMLTFLIGMAAFAVDLGWLYVNSSRIQRTADASALGGVTFMPSFPATAQSTAVDVASANGFVDGGNATLGYPPPPKEYQFSVSVTSPVATFFLRVFGQSSVTMTRTATAEYILPVPIGSPLSEFGYAPSGGYWGAISAPYTAREQGDFYANTCLLNGPPASNNSCDTTNPAYRSSGYYYAIDLPAGSTGLDIDIYDAGFYERGLTVETGDYDFGNGSEVDMRFTLFEPDGTPLNHTDNPPASCSSGGAGSDGIWNVDPEDSSPNTRNVWYNFCTIGSGATTSGRYVLQVQSLGNGYATNHYGIRANAISGSNPAVQGINDISIFANVDGGSSTFYFAEVVEAHAGKQLQMVVFDPGEGSGTNTITFIDPYGATPNCSYVATYPDGSVFETGSGSCSIDASNARLNTMVVTVTIDLAPTYTCNPAGSFGGCWWQANFAYASQSHDRTTWEARIVGNPIHLVND